MSLRSVSFSSNKFWTGAARASCLWSFSNAMVEAHFIRHGRALHRYQQANLESKCRPGTFYMRKNTTISPRSAGAAYKFTINFLLRRVTRVLWGVSHMTQHRLYLQCSLVNIWLSSSFETSRRFPRGAFSLAKRNGIRQGKAASHVNSHWLVNLRRIVPEKTQWKWIWGMRQDSCDARFSWKKIRNPRAVARVSYEFTVTRNARRILPEKTQGIRGRWCSAHFSLKNTTISPGWAGVTCKFTVEMKARRILHEKTQRFLRGRREWHVNLQSKWKPGAFYTRKHNDFSAVGGGPRRGCILIRNRD